VLAIELDRSLYLRVLLPAVGAREAHRLAEEFRQAFLGALDAGGRGASVDAAIGTATYPEDGPEAQDLSRFADWAVYCDKRARATPVHERMR
jgi:GGDEF domain-containing protein